MDWDSLKLYNKARIYAERANEEDMHSALFPFWMSLCLELLSRAALANTHPVLLADPRDEGNIQYAFGINPKTNPRSIVAKTVFARCSVFVKGFTDQMAAHCLILADWRNKELHTGAAVFEDGDASTWLPQTFEVFEILLRHCGSDFEKFLGAENAKVALSMLKDRSDNIKAEVQKKLAEARKRFGDLSREEKTTKINHGRSRAVEWSKKSALRKVCDCPACGFSAVIVGETIGRGSVKIDELTATISREVRVLPNQLMCATCLLSLKGFQELLAAQRGGIVNQIEEEDPIEFFGIIPEEHVDIDQLLKDHFAPEYDNE